MTTFIKNELVNALNLLSEFNSCELSEIQIIDCNETFIISDKELADWQFLGLNNKDYLRAKLDNGGLDVPLNFRYAR